MDAIIDTAILRAGSLLLESPDSLTYLITTFTLRSLPCDLSGLGIRRFGGLAGEITCLRGRTVLHEFANKYTPRLLEGTTLDFWPPIVLAAAKNRVWAEMAGLFRPESDFDVGTTTEEPTPSDPNIMGVFSAIYLASGESHPSATLSTRITQLLIARHGSRESEGRKLTSSPRGARSTASASMLFWFNSSIRARGRLPEASWLRSNRFQRSGCWLSGPGGFLATLYFPFFG